MDADDWVGKVLLRFVQIAGDEPGESAGSEDKMPRVLVISVVLMTSIGIVKEMSENNDNRYMTVLVASGI